MAIATINAGNIDPSVTPVEILGELEPNEDPPRFRRRVLELVKGERSVTEVAADLAASNQAICNWRRQTEIDAGLRLG
ncbi:hypothetical protein [Miltoncostaea marina]|uniref:hypothetical protein n=1 Tax=Miltoncostaea marina TaxID=2843215 RepID=UPI001C3DEE72|nr:hypothetical protein [Miltoncostaea marina]